jgi:hypothetical protein
MGSIWIEAQLEALFKPVTGGYVYRDGPVPRHYLVSEAQKAEILRRLQASVKFNIAAFVAAAMAAIALIYLLHKWLVVHPAIPAEPAIFVMLTVLLMLLVGGLQVFRRYQVGPALEGAPVTDKRITWRDRLQTQARFFTRKQLRRRVILWSLLAAYFLWTGFAELAATDHALYWSVVAADFFCFGYMLNFAWRCWQMRRWAND